MGPSAIAADRRPVRHRRRAAAAWTALALVLAVTAGARAELPVGTITEVVLKGNETLSREKVLGLVHSRAGREVKEKLAAEDRQRLISSKWFSRVEMAWVKDPGRGGFILEIVVEELPVLREVIYKGLSKLKVKEVEEATNLKKGKRFDPVQNTLAARSLQQLYHDKGYESARVRLVEGGKSSDKRVVFEIFEGPKSQIRAVDFRGNTFASDAMLRTKIRSRPPILGLIGGKFHQDELEEDIKKIKDYYSEQGFFEVSVSAIKHPEVNQGDVRITFVIWEGVQYKVRKVRFEGNRLLTEAKLREGLVMHSNQPFSDAMRKADLQSLQTKYGALGCIQAQIDPVKEYTDKKGIIDIVYRINEGAPYRLGRMIVRGNTHTRREVLLREANMAGLIPGEPLDSNRIEIYKKRLGNLKFFGGSQGGPGGAGGNKPLEVTIANPRGPNDPYGVPTVAPLIDIPHARMQGPGPDDPPPMARPVAAEPLAPGPGPAQVAQVPIEAIDPVEPPSGAVGIVPPIEAPPIGAPPIGGGDPRTSPAPTAPPGGPQGSRTPPVGSSEPAATDPSFPGANMTDVSPDRNEPFPQRAFADLVTSVDEVPTGRLMFGVGASSFQGLTGNLTIHESNFDILKWPRSFSDLTSGNAFRGRGQTFRLQLSPGTLINQASVSFMDPYVFNLPIGFNSTGYLFQRYYPNWTEAREGGRFSIGRQFGTMTYADVAVRAEDVNVYGFSIPAPADYLAVSGHTTLATIRPSIRWDNRNNPFSPNKGQYLEFAFEQGWGTFTFPKLTAEGRMYVPTGSRADGSGKRFISLRGYFGVTGPDTPLYERFYAGDFRTMRGFAYRGVGPEVMGKNVGALMMAIGSVEYQWPWTANDKIQQVVFCDFGTLENDYAFHTFRASVGTGVRLYLPPQLFGPLPLAFDLAFPVAKEVGDHTRYFNFSIGAFW